MRIWNLPVNLLDRQHLLGEHAELHAMVNAILLHKMGIKAAWQTHPQTIKYMNRVGQLYDRHNQQAEELEKRGFKHNTPLPTIKLGRKILKYTVTPEEFSYTTEQYEKDLHELSLRQEKTEQ